MSAEFIVGLLRLGDPTPAEDPREAVRLLCLHGLEGLAVARNREVGGGLLPPGVVSDLEPLYRAQGLASTLILETARRARAVLSGRHIDSLLFKGAALVADGTYPDPGARRMDDADVLVHPADAVRAVDALLDSGFEPVTGWDPAKVGWSDAVALHDGRSPPGTVAALDVHWRTDYDRLRFGGAGESGLWEGCDIGAGLPVAEEHLVLVAEHLLKHLRFKIHVAAFGDMVRIAAAVQDWDAVEGIIQRSRLAHGLRALLAVLARDFDAPVPRALSNRVSGPLADLLAPAALIGRVRPVQGQGRLAGIGHRWRLLGSLSVIAADVAEAAFPPNAWLRSRYGRGGAGAWLKYLADVGRWAVYRGRSPASPNQELFDARARE